MRCACDVDCQLGQRRGCSTPAHQQNFIPTDIHSRYFFCISTPKRPQKCWPVKIWVFRCVCWKVCWFGFYGLESPHKFSSPNRRDCPKSHYRFCYQKSPLLSGQCSTNSSCHPVFQHLPISMTHQCLSCFTTRIWVLSIGSPYSWSWS